MTASDRDHRLRRAEALRDLVRARLPAPERDGILAELDGIIASARDAPASGDMVRAAQEKAAQAEVDRQDKRKPYEADPLFMYLWRRRYGTRDYTASPFVRYFDRKVARLIDYETARINYTLLVDLPDRLREHANRLLAEESPLAADGALDAIEQRPEVAALLAAAAGTGDEIARRLAGTGAAMDPPSGRG
jgi:hypothetical protein